MATKKQLVMELRKAREAAQLFKEVAEAEKQAEYTLGVEETQARLTEEFFTVAKALEQPLFLLKDMEAYRTFSHPELFLSLKRDLAMVTDLTYNSI